MILKKVLSAECWVLSLIKIKNSALRTQHSGLSTPHSALDSAGQFLPITAMVMFSTVIFLVAVVNIYKITQAKLRVQNLADATALNIASQMASSLNKISDM